MSSRMIVLGSCGAWPEARRACTGFLFEHDGFRVVIDLGYDTLAPLLEHLGSTTARGLDAVIITHRHPDHMNDLHGLFRARWLGWPSAEAPALPTYAGEGVRERVLGLEEHDTGAVDQVFDWHPLPAPAYQVGPFRLQSWPLPHQVPNAGIRLTTADGLVVAFTGDSGPSPDVVELGRDADLFIVDATDRPLGSPTAVDPVHLSAREAGEVAEVCGARRLLLTHFWPDHDRALSLAAAHQVYGGEILLADEGAVIPLR